VRAFRGRGHRLAEIGGHLNYKAIPIGHTRLRGSDGKPWFTRLPVKQTVRKARDVEALFCLSK
jgi:hypothetical protein